ncbi:MAG TPA: hypothetical protein VKZ41_07440 [Gemmatimonadales bacterium]|nr:hypothetical protein [Gemmatimonadales bacterium]
MLSDRASAPVSEGCKLLVPVAFKQRQRYLAFDRRPFPVFELRANRSTRSFERLV